MSSFSQTIDLIKNDCKRLVKRQVIQKLEGVKWFNCAHYKDSGGGLLSLKLCGRFGFNLYRFWADLVSSDGHPMDAIRLRVKLVAIPLPVRQVEHNGHQPDDHRTAIDQITSEIFLAG